MRDIGFDTIGNATVICYDRAPILVTDPWVRGSAYFGSWGMSHEVPPAQIEAIRQTKFVWFSHGHPDHLNSESLGLFVDKKVLLPDHVGARIHTDLVKNGFDVTVLKDRKWYPLSERIQVMCIADVNQDAVLLIEINGRLVINANDSSDHGWLRFVRGIARGYEQSLLLSLICYGDVDMFHFFDEEGRRIPPAYEKKYPLGPTVEATTKMFGAKAYVPFSAMHRYQRRDSLWAAKYTTEPEDFGKGFTSTSIKLYPAYISYDCSNDSFKEINPEPLPKKVLEPQEFGDDWSEMLEAADGKKIADYFSSIHHLSTFVDHITFRVGGKDCVVPLAKRNFNRGIVFEVPRASLMTAIEYQVFDDLLIGNFMKTTLLGKWGEGKLHPDFTAYVTKYADNGLARSPGELKSYFAEYRRRNGIDYLVSQLASQSKNRLRNVFPRDSLPFKVSKKLYWKMRDIALSTGSH